MRILRQGCGAGRGALRACLAIVGGLLLNPGHAASSLPEQALANLRKLRSFRYTLVLKRTEPPIVDGSFSGAVILPDTVEQDGGWAGQPRLQIRARGSVEYLRNMSDSASSGGAPVPTGDTVWSIQERGTEADFLTQVEQVVVRDSFRLVSQDRRVAEFTFVPNMPFLDPFLAKKLTARFRVNRGRKLPVDITITSSDKVVFWQARFFGFDSVPRFGFPFVRRWRIALVPTQEIVDPGTRFADTLVMPERFRRHDLESRYETSGDTLVLFLERELRDDLLRVLVQPGEAEVWIGRFAQVKGPLPESARRLPLQADTLRRMLLERRVLTRADFAAVEVNESLRSASVGVTLTRDGAARLGKLTKLEDSGMFWAVVVDDVVAAFTRIEKRPRSDRIDFGGFANAIAAERVTAAIQAKSLAVRWKVASRQRLASE